MARVWKNRVGDSGGLILSRPKAVSKVEPRGEVPEDSVCLLLAAFFHTLLLRGRLVSLEMRQLW